MFSSMTTCMFLFIAGTDAGAADISVSVCLYSFEASSVIYKDPSCSDNASISFILLELILVLLHTLHMFCMTDNSA